MNHLREKPNMVHRKKEVETAIKEAVKNYREGRVSPALKNMKDFKAYLRNENDRGQNHFTQPSGRNPRG